MVLGITMIKALPGSEKGAYHALKEVTGIRTLYNLFGEYDFFVIVEARDRADLDHALDSIRDIGDISEVWPVLVSADDRLPKREESRQKVMALA